jgi:lysozyme family protein
MVDAVAAGPTQTSSAFLGAVSFVIDRIEGGGELVTDTGGLTRWGISQRAYPMVDIEHLPRDEAVALYRRDYWQRVNGDAFPGPLALALFDGAVNIGAVGAVKILQRLVGVPEDGVAGPQTQAAVARYRKPAQADELLALYLAARVRYYTDLVATKPVHTAALRGWVNRVMRVAVEAGRWSRA